MSNISTTTPTTMPPIIAQGTTGGAGGVGAGATGAGAAGAGAGSAGAGSAGAAAGRAFTVKSPDRRGLVFRPFGTQ